MKISACYIAKNEEKNIGRSLDSIKHCADELILVDTGSTDSTMDIFRSYGGKVFQQEWENDFSAPRNTAISHATGDWIILLDADEYFSLETRYNIEDVLSKCGNYTALNIKLINVDPTDNKILDEIYNLRIVRNIPGLKYRGKIHENIVFPDDEQCKPVILSDNDLKIIHTGYSVANSAKKSQRNIPMLLEELEAGRPEEEIYIHLADSYSPIDEEKSIYYAKKDVALGRRHISYASRSYRKLIHYYTKKGNKQERLDIVRSAVQDFPELPEFHAEYGECLYQCYEYEAAAREMALAITAYSGYSSIEPCFLDRSELDSIYKKEKQFLHLAEEAGKIKISACLICRNEEKNIWSWLDNALVYADEILIADTGSTDNTLLIAEEKGAKCFSIPWENDFSAAKNFLLDKAQGEWVVFSDADELFYNPQRVKGYIYSVNERNKTSSKVIDGVMVPMSNVDIDANDVEIHRFNSLRIFRNNAGLRYFGKVHESLNTSDGMSLVIDQADDALLMRHTGYSSSILRQKLERNLALLEKEISDKGEQPQHYRYLADIYFGLGKYELALKYSLQAIDSPMQAIGQRGDLYWHVAECLKILDYSYDEQMVLIDTAIREIPSLPDFYGLKGLLLLKGNSEDELNAEAYLCQAMEIYNAGGYKEASHFDGMLSDIYAGLGYCHYLKGAAENAQEFYITALNKNKWNEQALIGLVDLYGGEPVEALVEFFKENYCTVDLDKKILANIFQKHGALELAFAIDGSAELNKKISLFKRGNGQELINNSAGEIGIGLQELFVCLLELKPDKTSYTYRSQLALLPPKYKALVDIFHNEEEAVDTDAFSEYEYMFYAVLLMAREDTIRRYIEILALSECDVKEKLKLAEYLLKSDCYSNALMLYQSIPADSTAVGIEFWHRAGICLYHLGQYEAALECFENVENLIKEDSAADDIIGEHEAYLTWCREVLEA